LSQNMTIKSEVNSTQQNQTQNATSGQTINQNKTGHNSEAKLTFETKEEEKPIIESKESTEDEKTKAPSTPTGAIPADVQEIMEETDKEIAKMADNPMIKITSAITKAVMKIWSLVSGLFGGD
ncbi:MAG: hypothetical protein QW666_03725, partial [Candidatus Woesearchaeota archaeon]